MKTCCVLLRLLLTIIPARRGYKLAEERASYDTNIKALLDNPPLPQTRNTQHATRQGE